MGKRYYKGGGGKIYKTPLQFNAGEIEAIYFGVVVQAFRDLFSKDLTIKNDAFEFFNNNTFQLSDFVLCRIKKEYEQRSGKRWQAK